MIFQNCHKFHSRNGSWNYVKQLWNIMITRGIYAKYPLYKSCHYQYLCLSNHRDYNGGKYPLRITLLDRFESNLGKTSRWSKSLKIHENLTDVTVDIIVGGQLSINTTRNFFLDLLATSILSSLNTSNGCRLVTFAHFKSYCRFKCKNLYMSMCYWNVKYMYIVTW